MTPAATDLTSIPIRTASPWIAPTVRRMSSAISPSSSA